MHIEKREAPKQEIQKILELATATDLTYLKRTTDFTDEKQKDIFRNNFDMAWSNLGRTWGVLADSNCEICSSGAGSSTVFARTW
jgi:hypothetical protein